MSPHRLIIFFFILVLILAWDSAGAARVQGLYDARVPMYGTDAEARKEAMREALAQVLIKASGSTAVLQGEGIPQVLDKAGAYAQSFRFLGYRPGQFYQLRERPKQVLAVSFDGNAISRLLQSSGQPLWGHSRPSTLVWLLIENKGNRDLVDSRGKDLAKKLTEYAGQIRGLPVILPLMDLKDRKKVKAADIAGGFFDRVREASLRYETEAILIGKITVLGDHWNSRWTLIHDNRPESWEGEDAGLEGAVINGIGRAADRIASAYAQVVDLSQAGTMIVRVDDVRSLRDYARAGRYLQSLAAVRNVLPVLMEKDYVLYEVQYQGSDEGLIKTIALGTVLAPAKEQRQPERLPPGAAVQDPVGQPQAAADPQPGVSYRLVP